MTLAGTSPEFGTATEEVEVNYAGEDLVIGFNARYFLDILTQQGKSDIRIAFNDPNSPVLITGQDGTGDRAILMPMRVDRKSVVTGKSLSVRVQHGGCRILKKKQ